MSLMAGSRTSTNKTPPPTTWLPILVLGLAFCALQGISTVRIRSIFPVQILICTFYNWHTMPQPLWSASRLIYQIINKSWLRTFSNLLFGFFIRRLLSWHIICSISRCTYLVIVVMFSRFDSLWPLSWKHLNYHFVALPNDDCFAFNWFFIRLVVHDWQEKSFRTCKGIVRDLSDRKKNIGLLVGKLLTFLNTFLKGFEYWNRVLFSL